RRASLGFPPRRSSELRRDAVGETRREGAGASRYTGLAGARPALDDRAGTDLAGARPALDDQSGGGSMTDELAVTGIECFGHHGRSEEHTSELQSRENL